MNVLIVEDDVDIARLVAIQVEELQGHAYSANTLEEASLIRQQHDFDLIVLDLSLPDGDGIDFCRELRKEDENTPVLMLTARGNELDRVVGLEIGADDYLSKPFGLAELKARMKALLRRVKRAQKPAETDVIEIGALKIEPNSHQAWLKGEALTLTAKEFAILVIFAQHPTQVFSRSDLLNQIWGIQHEGYEHTVNSHLNRLRKKIEDNPNQPQIIETVWGVGYKLNPDTL
ncbi:MULTISPECIES: response regulator transcription factor [Thiomicrorhabdus]|uniref:Response regulator transcription factor n=1 Tax=Thiomicrorhabdus heinhorstiae TaxID=2748010 RepID=A0ABS0BXC8_9GAMM|nr:MULTISPECIES: response regulator transcription factor [Thiomicrorhabdus]MBF6057501.1 response regulator transcription factor [Thiomicrorhabdus heinhorstiae]